MNKPVSPTYQKVIYKYRLLIELVHRNVNEIGYFDKPLIFGCHTEQFNVQQLDFNPDDLQNKNIDEVIEARSEKLLQEFDFVILTSPQYVSFENPDTEDIFTVAVPILHIRLINKYIKSLNVTSCDLKFEEDGDSDLFKIEENDVEIAITYPNSYENQLSGGRLIKYDFKAIEVSPSRYLNSQKWFPEKLFANPFVFGLTQALFYACFYIAATFLGLFTILTIEDFAKNYGILIEGSILIYILGGSLVVLVLIYKFVFCDLLRIKNNVLSVRTGILNYTSFDLSKILDIEVENDTKQTSNQNYRLKVCYLDEKTKSTKSVIINPLWSKFSTQYFLTGLNAACYNYK